MRARTVIIINDQSEPKGGTAILALQSARLLHEAGLRVVYVTGDDGHGSNLPDGVEVIALHGKALLDDPFPRRVLNGLYNDAAARLVREVLEREDRPSTVYHLHSWAQTLSPSVMQALAPVQSRLIISVHDFSLVCPNGSYFNFQTEAVCQLTPLSPACLATHCDKRSRADKAFRSVRMLTRRQMIDLARTDALIAMIHPAMTEWMVRGGAGRQQLRTLRNPVTPFSSERVEAERNADIFFIGRLQTEKGVRLAADAARANSRRLRIIGEGPERQALEKDYTNLVFEGWLSHREIGQKIRAARAIIMPSRLPEPFGLVALEALQSGVPLIAFADSFVAQEAASIGAAFLATERTPEALARAAAMIDDNARVGLASEVAFHRCRDFSLTPQKWRDGMLALYEEQLGRATMSKETA